MKKIYFFIVAFFAISLSINAQNGTCLGADPFCTGTPITFPAGVGTGTAQAGPDYGCLVTQPNPAWYYMELSTGGNLDIQISNSNNEDIDFILYGPFADQTSPCTALLTAGNTEDCSYSTSATEIANIVGGVAGEFYLLLITNFSNNATDITFQDIGGTATTNCAIVCPPVDWGFYNGVTTEQAPLNLNCDDPAVLMLADQDGFSPGEAITPCVVIEVFPTNANNTLSIEFLENGTSLGTLFPGPNLNWSGFLSMADPNLSHSWILNEGAATGVNMTYQVKDCHSGAVLASGTWVDDGNPQTVTVTPPPPLNGLATWSVTPAAGIPALTVVTAWGGALFDPTMVPPGTYDVTYDWDAQNGDCAGNATHTVTVTNPFSFTSLSYTSPICQSAGGTTSPTLSATGGGGYTSSPAGLSINPSTGVINIGASTPNTYTVTYLVGTALPSACNATGNTIITILPDVNPAWTPPASICATAGSINLNTLITGTAGGSWGGTGVSGNTFNPAGLSGNIAVTYTVGTAPCVENSVQNINVIPDVDPGWTPPAPICANAGSINLNTLITGTAGGSWGGTGVSGNTFNPAGLSGNISITYTVGTAPCTENSVQNINVIPDVDPGWTPPAPICANGGPINLSALVTGTAGGSWGGTGVSGTNFNPAGLSGNIAVTYTVGTAPCTEQSIQNINVIPDVDPGWTPPAPICANGGPINLSALVTGTAGGSWGGTGVSGTNFNPAGLSGNISVTYTVGTAPCTEQSVQNINVIPDVDPSWTSPGAICESGGIISLPPFVTGTAGGSWGGTGVSGTNFNPAGLSGNIAVTYTVGTAPCTENLVLNINVIINPDASWTPPAPICESAGIISLTPLVTGTAGGTWSGSGVTGTNFDPTGLSGNIPVTYTVGTAPCTEQSVQNINVVPDVDPSWTPPASICETAGSISLTPLVTGTAGGTWSGSGVSGTTFNPAGLSGNIPVTYTVGTAPCVETSVQNINVIPDVDPSWTPPAPICEAAGTISLTPLVTGTAGGTWSGSGVTGTNFDPTGLSGNIPVTYTVGAVPCVETSVQNINVVPDVDPGWTPPTICENAGTISLTPLVTGTAGGTWSGSGVTGTNFDPTGLSGNIPVTYTVGTAPCVETSVQNINVVPDVDPGWTTPGTICEAAGTISLTPLVTGTAGGTWSGTGVTGTNFDPTGLSGNISVTYTVGTVPCVETSIQNINVVPDVDPTWTNPGPLCEGSGVISLTPLVIGTAGGSWSGTGVTGTNFDPTGLSGLINVTYTVGTAPCTENLQLAIQVDDEDDPSFGYASGTYCLTGTDPLPSFITTGGGTFTITAPGVINPATGEIDLSASGLGGSPYTITYNTASAGNPCPNSITVQVAITLAPTAAFTYDALQYCQDAIAPILTFGAGSSGGVFTSNPAGLSLNGASGAVDLTLSTPAVYTVYNTIAAAGGCAAAIDSTTIEVLQVDSAIFSYSPLTYCLTGTNPIPTMGGNATLGGVFTISAPGVLVSGATGEVDLAGSGLGNFTIYYNTTAAGNACPVTDSVQITITAAPTAGFSYDQAAYCQDSANPVLTLTGSNGVWSSTPAGLSLNAGTGAVDLLLSTPAVYTVYNTVAAAGGCAAALDSTIIEVLQVDSALFSYSSATFCLTGTNPIPTMGGNATLGGVFTISAPGVLVSSATGEVDLAGSGLGTFTVYYNTTAAGNACTALDSFVVNIVNAPGATFTYNTPFCEGDTSTIVPSFGANNFPGVFTSNPALVVFVSTTTGQIDLTTSPAGTYMIYNNLAAAGGCAAAVDSMQIVINPMYVVPQSTAICTGDSILLGGAFQNTAGVYSDTLSTTLGCDSIIQTTLTVNPVITTPQVAAICTGDSILLGGAFQTISGVYNDTLSTTLGCDSVVQTTLTVNSIILSPQVASICQGDSILLGGAFQTIAGVYNDTLQSVGGCDSVLQTTLTVDPLNSITADPAGPICLGDPLTLTATGSGNGTITWFSDAAGTNQIGTGSPFTPTAPSSMGTITYYVNEVGAGCPSNMDSVVVVIGGVTAVINATPITGAIPLNVSFGNGSTTGLGIIYDWVFGDGNTSNVFEPSNVYTNVGTYTATLTVTDALGCTATASVLIDAFGESSLIIPNVFTPNGDGSNDVFTVEGTNLESVVGEVYNRWGQKMFSWDNVKGHWDGTTLAGSEAPDGTYFFIITATGFDGVEYFEKGGFSLIR
jgi:gliding motility-associated-like protein